MPAEPVVIAFNDAEEHFAAQSFATARELLRPIVLQDKYFLPAIRQLGICELRLGNPREASQYLAKYCEFEPDDVMARANLAQAYLETNEKLLARNQISSALKTAPSADLYFLAAEVEEQLGELATAIKFYRKGLQADPTRTSAQVALARLCKDTERYQEAIQILTSILSEHPNYTAAITNLGVVYHAIGAYESAISMFEQGLGQATSADTHYNLGLSYQQIQLTELSIKSFQSAIDIDLEHLEAKIQLAESLSQLGKFDESRNIFNEILADNPYHCRVSYLATQLEKFSAEFSDHENRLRTLARSVSDRDDQVLVNFALAKIYDDSGRFNLAFEHVDTANKIRHKAAKKAARSYIDDLSKTAEIEASAVGEDNACTSLDPEPVPIFIVGMPRSGTTLLEQCIGNNAQFASCGELDYFSPALYRRRHQLGEFSEADTSGPLNVDDLRKLKNGYLARANLRGATKRYFVDKTPDNFKHYRLIKAMFPKALFVHCQRQAPDIIISIYFQLFEGLPYSFNLDEIFRCHQQTETIINELKSQNPSNWLTLSYEGLIDDADSTASQLSEFLVSDIKVSPNPPDRSSASVNTMSKWQVRQGVYRSSIDRWKNYAEQLAPFITRWGFNTD